MKISRKMLYLMSLGTLFLFPLLAFIILYFFSEVTFLELLTTGNSISEQLLRGLVFGITGAALAIWITHLDILKPVTSYFISMFKNLKLNLIDILFFSFCAGVGEELFFRGAMQPFCGIWPTAIFFIAIHGYLSFTNFSINLYGIMMVVVVAGFGYLAIIYGIWSAIAAHFIFDVIMFWQIKRTNENLVPNNNLEA